MYQKQIHNAFDPMIGPSRETLWCPPSILVALITLFSPSVGVMVTRTARGTAQCVMTGDLKGIYSKFVEKLSCYLLV